MKQDEQNLTGLLERRQFEPPHVDLAERIILASRAVEQKATLDFGVWLQRLFAEFMLPKPAYALACMLALGLAIGLSAPADITDTVEDDSTLQAFLYEEGEIL